jgi:hypothetical protein
VKGKREVLYMSLVKKAVGVGCGVERLTEKKKIRMKCKSFNSSY